LNLKIPSPTEILAQGQTPLLVPATPSLSYKDYPQIVIFNNI